MLIEIDIIDLGARFFFVFFMFVFKKLKRNLDFY